MKKVEEAAAEFAKGESNSLIADGAEYGFIAGAAWQREQPWECPECKCTGYAHDNVRCSRATSTDNKEPK